MDNVLYVKFPKKSKPKYSRQRVFYIGQYICGPPLGQSLQKLWLKRKPNNRWVFLEYHNGKADYQGEYAGNDLPEILQSIPLENEITIHDLLKIGWRHSGEVVNFAQDR